ncbi:hypothetical protein ONE63_003543 [Megalurothrips usitatus]|uniref:Uncharacterized protein n=1 Tax=Megalurothrips usitatus TaxID=439358 RepID=A0AAV7X797_9NEOP|nr:hypothetical protein ONE63_003543 [Megalurothrips usitatus]
MAPGMENKLRKVEILTGIQQSHRNEDALNYIIQRVDDLNLYNVDHCATAKQAWSKLKEIHTKLDVIQFVEILEELIATNKNDSMPMRDYIGKVTKLMKEIESVIASMNNNMEAMTAAFLIRGLKMNPRNCEKVKKQQSKKKKANKADYEEGEESSEEEEKEETKVKTRKAHAKVNVRTASSSVNVCASLSKMKKQEERYFDKRGFEISTKNGCKKISDKEGAFLVSFWDETNQMYKTEADFIEENVTKKKEEKSRVKISGNRLQVTWHDRFGHLTQLPERSEFDHCMHYRENLIIGFHVDDFIIVGVKPEVDLFKKQIRKFYEIKDFGRLKNLLGIAIQFKNSAESDYNTEEIPPKFCGFIYRQATGSLQHLVNNTRPDIAFAVSTLSQKNQDPTSKNWKNIKHLLKYLKQTKNLTINYKRTGAPLQAYVDADWSAKRSTTGYVIILGGSPIYWKTREVIYFKGLLREINYSEFVPSPSIINIDNQGAMKKAERKTNTEISKYIENKYDFIREEILNQRIKLEYVPSADNAADVFTKLLSGAKTSELIKKMGLIFSA